jgi:tetratricopeptide (TPR) repeat protein
MRESSYHRSMLCLLLWSIPSLAWAGESTPPAAPPTVEGQAPPAEAGGQARAEFEAGVGAFDASDFAAAADHFAKAQQLQPHPEVLLNLAQSELKAGRYAESATHFHAYIQQIAPKESAEARLGFTQARSYVAQVSIVSAEPTLVTLDGVELGTTPLDHPVFVAPGTHRFAAGSVTQTVIASAGDEMNVDLTEPEPTALADGMAPDTGRHAVSFPEWFLDNRLAWAGAGLTVAGLVFSGVSAGTSRIRYDAAENAKGQILEAYTLDGSPAGSPCGPPAFNATYGNACDVYNENRRGGDTWKAVSIVSLVVGVLSGAGTVALYFIDPKVGSKGEDTPTAQLMPVITPEFQSVTLSGRF